MNKCGKKDLFNRKMIKLFAKKNKEYKKDKKDKCSLNYYNKNL
jgi:hypothetical protein